MPAAAMSTGPSDPVISVVVPVRNEEANIAPLVTEISAALAGIAHDKMRARFAELETCTAAVVEVLRDLDGWGRVIRLHRDWLYGSLRAWEGLLTAWESGGLTWSQDTWALLRRTYRFLAPRFMPRQEWQSSLGAYRADAAPRVPMVW